MSRPAILTALGVGAFSVGIVSVWWTALDRPETRRTTVESAAEAPVHRVETPLPPKPAPLRALKDAGTTNDTPAQVVRATTGFSPAPSVAVENLTREELEYRALRVEQQANHELRNLLTVLDLSEEQQDRAFAILAEKSNYFHPALQFQNATGGNLPVTTPTTPAPRPSAPSASEPGSTDLAAATTPEADPLEGILTDEQRQAYERYTDERESFWSGVVERIEAQISQ